MAVPEVIPIAYEPGHRTDTIGTYADGQFYASITYAFPDGVMRGVGWEDLKALYAVLHRFDHEGRHVDSDIWRAGTWREQQQQSHADGSPLARAQDRMSGLLNGLPKCEYGDIAVRPFRLVVDGVVFGLITERHGELEDEDDWAELYPDRLGFCEPWNGEYST